MRGRLLLCALTCLLALAPAGCNTGQGVSNGSTHGALRAINVIPNAGAPLNFTFDNKSLITGLGFESMTEYQTIDSGSRRIQVMVAGSSTDAIDTTLDFLADNDYTYIAFGPVSAAGALIVDDSVIVDPGAGKFALRVINGASNNAVVDVYVTPPGVDLNTVAPSVAGVTYGAVSGFANIDAGSMELRVTPTASKQVIYDSTAQTFVERAQIEAVVYSRGSSSLVNVALLKIDDRGTGSIANSNLARFKAVNGSSVGSPLNVFVDGDLALSNIPYAAASTYATVAAGTRSLTVEATATPGATLLSLAPTFAPATDSTITLTGPAGALTATVFNDANSPPKPGRARVRVVNSSADVAALDVFINFSRQISGLAMNTASAGVELDADPTSGTTYEFDFNVSGSSQTILQLPAVTLQGGRLYSIYLVGPAAALSAVVVPDN